MSSHISGSKDFSSQWMVSRTQLRADVAYCMLRRSAQLTECYVRFAWLDASPQGAFDFLIMKWLEVPARRLMDAVGALTKLMLTPGGAFYNDDEFEQDIAVADDRARCNQLLSELLCDHICVPSPRLLVRDVFRNKLLVRFCLRATRQSKTNQIKTVIMGIHKNNTDTKVPISQGQGVTSSEAKVVGVHHMVGVEAFDISHVQRIVREMWSFTTDLGTDVKVTDFSIDPTKRSTLMPSWMSADVAALPLVEEFPEDFPEQGPAAEPPAVVGYHNPFVQCEGQEALVNAIPISGVGHSIHNIAKLLPDAMKQFKWFKKRLKTLEMVLRHPGRSERIVATCIVGTPYGKHSNIILSFGYTLHEARWQSLILFCQATVLPLAVLRRAWSQEQYEGNGVGKLVERGWSQEDGSDGQKFNPQELTDLLKSVFSYTITE